MQVVHWDAALRAVRYENGEGVWAVQRFRGTDPLWYARLRIGTHRFSGQGGSAVAALKEARAEGQLVCRDLLKALELM